MRQSPCVALLLATLLPVWMPRKGLSTVWETREFSGACSPVIHHRSIYTAYRDRRCFDFETGTLKRKGERVVPGNR